MPTTTISAAIADVSDRLTPTERRIAGAIVEEPTLLAFGTVSEVADRVGTSRPSIVRFANKLGFDGYSSLQQTARDGLARHVNRPSERFRADHTTTSGDFDTLTSALDALAPLVTSGHLASVAPLVSNAKAVWIVSGETSRAAAHAMHSGLSIIRPRVHLLDDHSMGRELAAADSADVAIVSDFPRYREAAVVATRALAASGVPIIAITDGPLSPLATSADVLVDVAVPAIGPFDSSVTTVAIAELIVAEVARLNRDVVQQRIDRTEDLWRQTKTFFE